MIGSWGRRVKEVRRVVERSLESDCVYDHPLIRLTSRDALLSHFVLLHLAATAYLPSLAPYALVGHANTSIRLTFRLARNIIFGRAAVPTTTPRNLEKGKGRAEPVSWDEKSSKQNDASHERREHGRGGLLGAISKWYGFGSSGSEQDGGGGRSGRRDGWWQLWEVNADCREIGGMECYDGIHLAMIEQVITLTILPALLASPPTRLDPHPASFHSLDLEALESDPLANPSPTQGLGDQRRPSATSGSEDVYLPLPIQTHDTSAKGGFVGKLVGAIAREFEYLLRWELPISTMVEFNEVGKATRIRDVIDIQDLVETFVPFAKRFSWLTRSLNGLVSSAVGTVLLGASAAEKEVLKEKKGVMVPISTSTRQ